MNGISIAHTTSSSQLPNRGAFCCMNCCLQSAQPEIARVLFPPTLCHIGTLLVPFKKKRKKIHTNLDISPGEIPSWGSTSLEFSRKSSYKPCQFGDFPVWGHQRGNSSPLKSHSNPIRPPCLMVETTGSRHFGWSNLIRSCYSKCQFVDGSACPSSLFTPWSPFLMFKSPCALVPYHIFLRKKKTSVLCSIIFIQLKKNLHLLALKKRFFNWFFITHVLVEISISPELAQAAGIHGTSIQRLAKTFRELRNWWATKMTKMMGKMLISGGWLMVLICIDGWLMVDWWLIDGWLVVDWCFFAQMTQDAIVSARTFQIFQKNKTVFSRNIENWFSPTLGHHQSSAGLHQHHSYTFGGKKWRQTNIHRYIHIIYKYIEREREWYGKYTHHMKWKSSTILFNSLFAHGSGIFLGGPTSKTSHVALLPLWLPRFQGRPGLPSYFRSRPSPCSWFQVAQET